MRIRPRREQPSPNSVKQAGRIAIFNSITGLWMANVFVKTHYKYMTNPQDPFASPVTTAIMFVCAVYQSPSQSKAASEVQCIKLVFFIFAFLSHE